MGHFNRRTDPAFGPCSAHWQIEKYLLNSASDGLPDLHQIKLLPNTGTQRRLFARPPECFVRRLVVRVKSSNERNASFTAAESTNTLATSGSSMTTLAPSSKMRMNLSNVF